VTVVIHGVACIKNAKNWKYIRITIFLLKLAPEFFDAKLIICITFPDKPGDILMWVLGFKGAGVAQLV
jgi:hypothetical protein